MKQYSTISIFVFSLLQLSFSQDYSKVDAVVQELKKSLRSVDVQQPKEGNGEKIGVTVKVNVEQTLPPGQKTDTARTVAVSVESEMTEANCSSTSTGQVKFGVDLYSRYIWRGLDYGNAPSFQPALSYTYGNFSIGTWAAYSMGVSSVDLLGAGKVFAEHDLWASYGIPTDAGTFSLFYTDYFYPSAGLKYFNFNGTTGAHVLELGAGFSGTEKLPVTITAYYNFHNDVDHSIYIQGSYLFSCESFSANLFAAVTPAKSVWYGTSKADLINIGVTVSKSIVMTDKFSLPLTVSYIVNPDIEQTYLIVGITL